MRLASHTLTLLWLFGAWTACADKSLPTDLRAQLAQREDFGVKVKLSYTIKSPKTSKVEVCVGCDVDMSSGKVVDGGTCGGFPNGCATVKMSKAEAESQLWTQDALHLQLRVDGGAWSEPVKFRVDKSAKGNMGMLELERISKHNEL
eukprot:TRINITY_DN46473_c0_g1_i1.p1 TRINITY_DN46473_c0_g1~~TRINITY_DN46473_c0_g1_i1.p1  ORF type:complete len:147 (-),score=35.92 TRINITY_DN46473_c0_g1_i1:50-490(-)